MFYSVIEIRDFSLFNQSAQAVLKGYFIMHYIIYILRLTTYFFHTNKDLGPVVQRWVSANAGFKFNLLF